MTEQEILIEYAEKQEDYNELEEYDKMLYRVIARETLEFKMYLLKKRLEELGKSILKASKILDGKK